MSFATRAFAVAVVLLAAGSQISSSLHRAFVEHEVCAEHGEVVHGSTGLTASAEPASGISAGVPSEAHGHEHCLLAALRDETGLPEAVEADVHRLDVFDPVAAGFERGHPPRSPLSVAPKASPPV